MENALSMDNENDKKRQGPGFSDAVENAKKVYRIGKKLAQVGRLVFSFLISHPWLAGVLVILILIILAFFSIFFGLMNPIPGGSIPSLPGSSGTSKSIDGLELQLIGPSPVDNGANMKFTINITYSKVSPPLSSITVYAIIPPVGEFVEATGAFEFNNGEIRWPMSQNNNSFTFTVRATATDTEYPDYRVYATIASGSGAGAAPTNNACGGKYDIASNPIGANFGDPGCNFTKDDLYELLKTLDSKNADKWYFSIVPCESGYNPNAYNGAAVDAAGAYGLYQMGRGKNGQLDHGDVEWSTQTSNAVKYNKDLIGESFAYWACS